MRQIPQVAIDLIRGLEGCLLRPYKDSAGKMTIGIGHLIKPGEEFSAITPQEAEDLLRADMEQAACAVMRLITRPLTDNQYAALLSFTYNEGGGTLQHSTLRQKCNRHDDGEVPHEFKRYIWARDPLTGSMRKSDGLRHRREIEAALYGVSHLGYFSPFS